MSANLWRNLMGVVVGMLCFLATVTAQEIELGPPMAEPAKVPTGQVHIQLRDGSVILGKIDLGQTFTLAMNFGEIRVSARRIISLEFDDKGSVRIRSLGGDIYTGKVDADVFSFQAPWGNVKIPQKYIKLVVSKSHVITSNPALKPVISVAPNGRVTTTFVDEVTALEMAGTNAAQADEYEAFSEIAEDLNEANSGSRD